MKALWRMVNTFVRNSRESSGSRARILQSQSGQALVEVALLTPLLLLTLIGVIEVGRYAYISILVGNAARAGAAYAAQSLPQSVDCGGIVAASQNDFQNNGQDVSSLTVAPALTDPCIPTTSCGCDSGGTVAPAVCDTKTNPNAGTCAQGHWVVMVSVTASGTFNSLFKYPGIPPSITVSRTCTMRVAQN